MFQKSLLRRLRFLIFISFILQLQSCGLTAPTASSNDRLIAPESDPWYSAPPGFAEAEPGEVLRVRVAPGNLTAVTANCSAAYNILFRTTDSRYRPAWAVTTLFVPQNTCTASNTSVNSCALLSYQYAYDSADLNASPSYKFYSSAIADVALALGQGWFVSVPDYEGPLASYTAGVASGYATLDSVRAVRTTSFGLTSDARCVMWGYSGGALASEWAAELQVQYAPELRFNGAALGGLTPNITSVLQAINGHAAAGLIPAGLLGLTNQFPEAQELILSNLRTEGPKNKTGFLDILNETVVEALENFAMEDIGDYFVDGLEFLQNPRLKQLLENDGQMGYHGVPQMPLYVYKAVADEISPIADTDALVATYCGVGAKIFYTRNHIGSHAEESLYGRAGAISWLEDVLSQDRNMAQCVTQEVSIGATNSTE